MNAFQQAASQLAKKTKITHSAPFDLDDLEITDDPVKVRTVPKGKYEEKFAKMKPGQCLKCKPEEVQRLASAMRKYVYSQGREGRIVSVRDYGDGRGRVWMPKEQATGLKRAA